MVKFFIYGNVVSSMSSETDAQGRLYIPKEVRQKYGQKFHIVMYEDRIELIPVADDPLAAVREAAGELRNAPADEIREDIEAEAKDEAEGAGGDR
jgi:bifunctional DNA-binding transcriptional regulator/antitoxin component of YhaV-PrlF toxin-antitoxin module